MAPGALKAMMLEEASERLHCLNGLGHYTKEEWIVQDLIFNKKRAWGSPIINREQLMQVLSTVLLGDSPDTATDTSFHKSTGSVDVKIQAAGNKLLGNLPDELGIHGQSTTPDLLVEEMSDNVDETSNSTPLQLEEEYVPMQTLSPTASLGSSALIQLEPHQSPKSKLVQPSTSRSTTGFSQAQLNEAKSFRDSYKSNRCPKDGLWRRSENIFKAYSSRSDSALGFQAGRWASDPAPAEHPAHESDHMTRPSSERTMRSYDLDHYETSNAAEWDAVSEAASVSEAPSLSHPTSMPSEIGDDGQQQWDLAWETVPKRNAKSKRPLYSRQNSHQVEASPRYSACSTWRRTPKQPQLSVVDSRFGILADESDQSDLTKQELVSANTSMQTVLSNLVNAKIADVFSSQNFHASSTTQVASMPSDTPSRPLYQPGSRTKKPARAPKELTKPDPPKTVTCWFWDVSKAGCRYRPEECYNLHCKPPPPFPVRYPMKNGKPTWGSIADATPVEVPAGKTNKTCFFWAMRGQCEKSDDMCNYVHGYVSGGVAPRPTYFRSTSSKKREDDFLEIEEEMEGFVECEDNDAEDDIFATRSSRQELRIPDYDTLAKFTNDVPNW